MHVQMCVSLASRKQNLYVRCITRKPMHSFCWQDRAGWRIAKENTIACVIGMTDSIAIIETDKNGTRVIWERQSQADNLLQN